MNRSLCKHLKLLLIDLLNTIQVNNLKLQIKTVQQVQTFSQYKNCLHQQSCLKQILTKTA